MGLRLPTRLTSKIAYTGFELFIILVTSLIGGIRLFPFLYVVFVLRNCLIFERRTRSIVTGIAFLLCVLTLFHRLKSYAFSAPAVFEERVGFLGFSFAVLYGLVVIGLELLVDAVLSERRSREQLAAANEQLRDYALRIEDVATLQERNRIAREIHDSLGHSLTVFNLHLEAAMRLLQSNPAEAQELLVEAKQVSSKALREVRQSVAALRSDPLQGRSLKHVILDLANNFQRSTRVLPECNIEVNRFVPATIQNAVYRIVQEALTNICKYASATEVTITVTTPSDLQVSIRDNGKGFDWYQTTQGFGLQGMRERTTSLGGTYEAHTTC
jgi:signal transduction histidine kinase